ncbi:MAG: IS1182 family transposase [Fibrobacter sp.]|nr:IS1182 family transposase [Fibrobacter sp.]
MSSQIDADYSKVFLFPPSLEDFVPANDPVRFIRAFVDSLDLENLGFITRVSKDGRPGFAPSLLLKIWLYGSYERISSCRKLERKCKRDLALLWLSGMNYPDHNTLWRFFFDNKKAIKQLFKKSVQVAIKNDLVGMVYHAIDGTKICANASRFKKLDKKGMKILLERLDEYIAAMERQIKISKDEPDDRLPEGLQKTEELKKRVKETVDSLQNKENGTLNIIDIDSRRIMTNKGITEYSYNAQAVADQKCGIIVGSQVTQAESDNHLLTEMIAEVKDTAGSNAKYSVADAGYFSGEEIAKSEELQSQTDIYVNIPKEHNSSAVKKSDDKYHTNNFRYDKEQDVYICPHGTALKKAYQRSNSIAYNCTGFDSCSYKSFCTRSKKIKQITVHKNHEQIRRHKEKIKSEEARALLRQRGGCIEKVFGHIKEQLGLRRFRAVGKSNAEANWYFVCTIYNLQKIWTVKGISACFT